MKYTGFAFVYFSILQVIFYETDALFKQIRQLIFIHLRILYVKQGAGES